MTAFDEGDTEGPHGYPAPTHLEIRPVRLIRTCRISAVVMVVAAVAAALLLGAAPSGAVEFGLSDQASVVLIGIVGGAGVMWFARPRVVADPVRIQVRNLGPTHEIPWQVVTGVRYDMRTSWAVLELADDDTLGLMAVQRADGVRAESAVAELRAMLEAAHRPPVT